MRKVIIKEINNYDYTLEDQDKHVYVINVEFYSNYKPKVNDIMYFPDNILEETNLYAFDEVYNTNNYNIDDFIKVVSEDKDYFYQRRYG